MSILWLFSWFPKKICPFYVRNAAEFQEKNSFGAISGIGYKVLSLKALETSKLKVDPPEKKQGSWKQKKLDESNEPNLS